MKNLKNKLFVIVVLMFAISSFTSCDEDDYYWKRVSLEVTTVEDNYPPTTNSFGKFDFSYDLYDTDIYNFNPRYDYLEDIRLNSTEIYIFNDQLLGSGDRVELYLKSDGIREYSIRLSFDKFGEAYINGNQDRSLLDFMYDYIDKLVDRGNARLYIYGVMYDSKGIAISNIPFDIEIINKFELYVRE